jgi:hypothetical protein
VGLSTALLQSKTLGGVICGVKSKKCRKTANVRKNATGKLAAPDGFFWL